MPQTLLQSWLCRQLAEPALDWLEQKKSLLTADTFRARDLYAVIGLIPRKLGKAPLMFEEADLLAADQTRPGWNPEGMTVDEAARLLILLTAHCHGEPFYAK